MSNSRGAPVEDSKVIRDLDRVKENMGNWAKNVSLNDVNDIMQPLDGSKRAALKDELDHVLRFEDNKLPQGLSPGKSPALILTALLSHEIYATLFQSPFFFLGKSFREEQFEDEGIRAELEGIHSAALRSNKEDAYLWRSQTLRLLLPPAATASEKERELRYFTETSMDRVVDLQTTSAAQYLVSHKARANCEAKLRAIYLEAATISYNLWTRTFLKCTTLKDWNHPGFHPDDKHMILHYSVDYESHEDQLVGKASSIMVHPLLEADKGKDFDHGRVWAPAEGWVNSSRMPSVECCSYVDDLVLIGGV